VAYDVAHVETLLQAAAAQRETFSYSALLLLLGHNFSRPRMRTLCAVLDVIDQRAEAAGQPELAALVVREADALPGQGWWIGRRDYAGAFEGSPARKYLLVVQRQAFDYWQRTAARDGGAALAS
jgi:hypothetical protein